MLSPTEFNVIIFLILTTAWIYFFRLKSKTRKIQVLKNCKWKGKRFVVICNQFGGKRAGRAIAENIVRPMCDANEVSTDIMYTEYHKHAVDIGATLDFSKYDGIVVVSGDGLVHELLNGIASRSPSRFYETLPSLPPIAVVPGGTCNGLATSLTASEPHAAICKILEGSRQLIDVYHAVSPNGTLDVWDVHGCAWAMLSEADEVLGKIRWVPHILREPLAALYLIAKKRVYSGTLYFNAVEMDETTRKKSRYNDFSVIPVVKDGPYKGYRVIEGEFIMLAVMNTDFASFDMKLTPAACATDGCVDVVIMRGHASRLDVLLAFLNMERGDHAGMPGVELYKVSSLTLRRSDGNINVSGEIYPTADINVTIFQTAIPFIF